MSRAISRPFAPRPFHEAVDGVIPQQLDPEVLSPAASEAPGEDTHLTAPTPGQTYDQIPDGEQLGTADCGGTQIIIPSPQHIDIPGTLALQRPGVTVTDHPSNIRPQQIGTVPLKLVAQHLGC